MSARIANAIAQVALLALVLGSACDDPAPSPESHADGGSMEDASTGGSEDASTGRSDASTGGSEDASTGGSEDASTGGGNLDGNVPSAPRGLYTWTFGELEMLSATEAVALLRSYGYAGIVVDTSREVPLQSYLSASENTADFRVVAAYVALQLHRGEQFSNSRHKAAIDALAQAGRGDLWMTFRDDNKTQTQQALTNLTRGVVEYASAKGVRVLLYPHDNNVHPTTKEAMMLVNEINAPNFGVALNLTHELRAGNSDPDTLGDAFDAAGAKLFAITLAGASEDLTQVRALHESSYELSPFIELIKDSGFSGPVGFLNHTLTNPKTYLPLSMGYWQEQW